MIEFERDNVTRVDFRRRQRIPDDPMYSELDALHQGAAQFWESGHELTVFIDDLHYQEDITDQERQVLLYWLGQTIGIIPISAQTRMTVQKQFVEDLETLVEQELDFWDGLTDGMKAILGTNRLMLVLDQVHSILVHSPLSVAWLNQVIIKSVFQLKSALFCWLGFRVQGIGYRIESRVMSQEKSLGFKI
jgi:hypothetical protein